MSKSLMLPLVIVAALCSTLHAADPAGAVEVGKRLAGAEIWNPEKPETGATPVQGWLKIGKLSKEQLTQVQDLLEASYEKGASEVPGGVAGTRMMLRALRVRLGPNQEISKALQLRLYCICPPSVDIKYKEKDGAGKRYQWTMDNPAQFVKLVNAFHRGARTQITPRPAREGSRRHCQMV